jgi:3-isopropylmalate/(R)-2-methylmalate dehydratase small subunit
MKAFKPFESHMAPLPGENIDTDQITPARFLKGTPEQGYAAVLFYDWRFDDHGNPRPDFVLNQPEFKDALILLAGDNFGAGSSRETAPWALVAYGIRAIISTSFADIFRNNSLKNGLLPIVVDEDTHQQLFSLVEEEPGTKVHVDLESGTLTLPDGRKVGFPIDSFFRECLLKGVDQMGYLLDKVIDIEAYEAERPAHVLTMD